MHSLVTWSTSSLVCLSNNIRNNRYPLCLNSLILFTYDILRGFLENVYFNKIQQQHLLNPRWIFTTRNCTQTVITSRMFLAYSNVLYFHILYFHIFHVRRIYKVLWPTFFREYLSRRVNDRCSNSVHTYVIGNASALNLCKGFIGIC